MSKNKWVRSISFNKTNPADVERLKLIGKKSFSRYIKRLLDDEIKKQKSVESVNQTNTDTPQQKKEVVAAEPKPSIYEIHEQKRSQQHYQKQPVQQPQYYQPQQAVYNPMLHGQRRRKQ